MQHEKLMESLIIKDFRTFYEEIVRLKAKALSDDFIASDIKSDSEVSTSQTICQSIQGRLLNLLKEQQDYVELYGGGFAVGYYREAQYIMTALADEIFLNMDWIGRTEWKGHLLESQLFHTQIAGEKFFRALEEFLRVRDSSNSDIGVLYIIALGLGFKGKYRDEDDHGALKKYLDQLYGRVMKGSSHGVEGGSHLFPQAYEYNIVNRESIKVPSARMWALILLGVVGTYLVVSYFIWMMHVGELEVLINQISQWMTVQ